MQLRSMQLILLISHNGWTGFVMLLFQYVVNENDSGCNYGNHLNVYIGQIARHLINCRLFKVWTSNYATFSWRMYSFMYIKYSMWAVKRNPFSMKLSFPCETNIYLFDCQSFVNHVSDTTIKFKFKFKFKRTLLPHKTAYSTYKHNGDTVQFLNYTSPETDIFL